MVAKSDTPPVVRIPADRLAGVLQVTTLLPIGAAIAFIASRYVSGLRFHFSPTFSHVVTYSLAFVVGGLALIGLLMAGVGLRWLVFGLWPGRLGLSCQGGILELRLGPFGSHRIALRDMQAVYRHERDPEDELLSTEDFALPEDEIAHRLPLLLYRNAPMNRTLYRFLVGEESDHLKALRPMIDYLRAPAATGVPSGEAGDDD
jgi:hypothetical protein